VDVDVDLDGLPELVARLGHAHDGILDLTHDLGLELMRAGPPMMSFTSTAMRPRTWGPEDLWQLPAGSWVAGRDGRVHLPKHTTDDLTIYVQELLDGH
jgi:hypothetical protein